MRLLLDSHALLWFYLNAPSLSRVAHAAILDVANVVLVGLPFHHKDPFDRLLIVQAMTENLRVVSADKEFDAYPVSRIW